MLDLAMSQVQAWELLNNPEYCGQLDMIGLRRLMIRAGYSKETIREATLQRGWDRLGAGEAI